MFIRKKNDKGVTLIELVIVLVIIAILAVLMVPNIGAWLPNYRLRSATRDVVSTLRMAQAKAVSNNTQYRVNFNAAEIGAANSYLLQHKTGGLWVSDGALQTLPTGISMSVGLLPNGRAEFNPDSTSSAGSVTLQNARGMQKQISLTSGTGRIRSDP